MKNILPFVAVLCTVAIRVLAQSSGATYTVTPSATTYSSAGGQISFTVNLTYPADAAAVAFSVLPPSTSWVFVSSTGTGTPDVAPNPGDVIKTDYPAFGWTFKTPPLGSATFSFTLSYPAGMTGSQLVAFPPDGCFYRLGLESNPVNPVTVQPITLTLTGSTAAPTVSNPANQSVVAGSSGTFSVTATGSPAPNFQWQRSTDGGTVYANLTNDSTFSGVNLAILTVNNVTTAMNNHRFRVVASNGVGTDATSTAALLNVLTAPVITTQPLSQSIALQSNATFTVVASGNPTPTYQWRQGTTNLTNGGRISGATSASLTITNLQASDAGAYNVIVSNGISPDVTSSDGTLSLLPVGYGAAHSVIGAGYVAGSTLTITNTLTFAGDVTGLGWQLTLPTGWSFASSTGNYNSAPAANQVGTINWVWFSGLTSPQTFTYTVNVPASATGNFSLAATATVSLGNGDQVLMPAQPNPLVVGPVIYHSADTSHDFKIDLNELLRLITYFNTRFTNPDSTKTQTGCYKVQAGTIDGFAPDSSKSAAAAAGLGGLATYHSADTDHNGAISLNELLRVITYFNTRYTNPDNTKSQTGAYKVQAGTIDGYAPDPARTP